MSQPRGLDLQRLRTFLDVHRPGLINGELKAQLIAGGRSNLTYDVTDGSGHWVIRRPPLGHVLATAHDMSREYRILTALQSSPVPVPLTIVVCEDNKVLGAPFYVMEKVAGIVYRRAAELDALGPERTQGICECMVDTLATLHALDPNLFGLNDFGQPEGFLRRQLARWRKQLDSSRSRELPGIEKLHAKLVDGMPAKSPAAIVHGDYRLDNLLIDDNDAVAAVLDWEMATLGDPFTDIALLMAYSRLPDVAGADVISDVTRANGYPTPEQLLERYHEHAPADIDNVGFYLAFAYFKLAVILEGIHFRYTQGKTLGAGFDRIGTAVVPLAAAGLAAFKGT